MKIAKFSQSQAKGNGPQEKGNYTQCIRKNIFLPYEVTATVMKRKKMTRKRGGKKRL